MIYSFMTKKLSLMFICSTFFVSSCHAQDDDIPDISVLFKEAEPSLSLVCLPPLSQETVDLSDIPYPDDIYSHLTQYTIGQDTAMRSLATFIYEHLVNMKLRELAFKNPHVPLLKDLDLSKPNILMMGPTGCGKTSSLELLAQYLKVPLAIGNATEWTSQGYIGRKWQDMFEKLYNNAATFVPSSSPKPEEIRLQAQKGIVFIDEIDKLCAQNSGDLKVINRVQQELLPVIQGIELNLNNGEVLHTKNILFIAGGAFPDLISSERSGPSSLPITPQILESYGMLPELAGRLGNIVQFNALDKSDLKKIILESKNSSLRNYITKYKVAYQIDLRFSEQTIDYIAEVAALQKTGARAINAMIFNLMEDITFNIRHYKGKPLCIEREEAIQKLEKFMRKPTEEMDPSLSHLYL